MKQINILIAFLLLITLVKAQTPQGFNYSAVARDASGKPLANRNVSVQLSILKTSPTGALQYAENHLVNTDGYGLFNLVVGNGTAQSGSISNIQWGSDNHYLKVAIDANGGSNYITMGTTQIMSVPYALNAKKADNGIDRVSSNGDTLYLSNGQTFVAGGSTGGTGNLVLPTITTNAVTGITSNSATFGGAISNANGNQIMERGIVYSTSPNPTINSTKIKIGAGIGTFDSILDLDYQYAHLLKASTTYYIRAYAITENNISSYGNEVSFTTLSIGQIGPGGGLVFFDKGNNVGGWQYLETATNEQSTGLAWGCNGTSIPGTQFTVGSGESNTSLIVAGCIEASFAAKICDNLSLGGQTDWFLPSRDELNLMYKNLHTNNQGNFNNSFNYWSSTEYGTSSGAWSFSFSGNGGALYNNKVTTYYVRAIRAF
jgi:hypothetical protein